jgi:type IV secretion system protein VirD4
MIVLRWLWFLLKVLWVALLYAAKGLAFVTRAARTDFRTQGALGTARWATAWEKFSYGVYRGVGPVVGKGSFGRLMRFNRDGIVQVFASQGAGKGLGIVVPTLLDYPGSMVVTDVKGENYAITARHRDKLGRVVMLNPSQLARSDRFNPMDTIRVGSDQESDDARALARLMVTRDSADGHWADKSTAMLTALILHALHEQDEVKRTLAHVCKLSVGGPNVMRQRLVDIAEGSPSALAQTVAQGFLGTMGEDGKPNPEFASVLSDLQKATEPWAEGTPAGTLSSESTFQLEDLNKPDIMTLYLCVDEEKLDSYARWLRVMTGCTLNAIMRSKRTQRPKHKVLLLLDEARALGRLDPLVNASGFLRTYCMPVLIWQNMLQVRAIYGHQAGEFLANASCRVYFGITDNETAFQISQLCGQTGVRTQSQGVSQASDAWVKENRSQGENDGGYWLIDPSEVQRLPDTTCIVKMRHVPFPMLTTRATYFRRLRWLGRFDRWTPDAPAPVTAPNPARPPGPPLAPSHAPTPPPGAYASAPPPAARSASPPAGEARW